MIIKLARSIKVDEKEINEINLKLEDLTGEDMLDADRQIRALGVTGFNPMYSQQGLLIVASKASGIIPEDLAKLSAPDFLDVTASVTNFLMGWTSVDSKPSETSEEPS